MVVVAAALPSVCFFFFQAEDGIRDIGVTGVQTCALPISPIVILMFIALCVILILLNPPEVRQISGATEYINEERSKLGPFSRGERNTLIVLDRKSVV